MANVGCVKCGTEIPVFLAKRTNGICGDCGGEVKYSPKTLAIVKGSLLAFFIVVGVAMTAGYISVSRRADHIEEYWRRVSAEVTDFKAEYLRGGGVTDSEAADREYTVEYAYTVDGVKYVSEYSRRGYPGSSNRQTRENNSAFYHDHQPGKPVQIYYNPENPGECYIARQVDRKQLPLWSK